jgi:hypothetical protein
LLGPPEEPTHWFSLSTKKWLTTVESLIPIIGYSDWCPVQTQLYLAFFWKKNYIISQTRVDYFTPELVTSELGGVGVDSSRCRARGRAPPTPHNLPVRLRAPLDAAWPLDAAVLPGRERPWPPVRASRSATRRPSPSTRLLTRRRWGAHCRLAAVGEQGDCRPPPSAVARRLPRRSLLWPSSLLYLLCWWRPTPAFLEDEQREQARYRSAAVAPPVGRGPPVRLRATLAVAAAGPRVQTKPYIVVGLQSLGALSASFSSRPAGLAHRGPATEHLRPIEDLRPMAAENLEWTRKPSRVQRYIYRGNEGGSEASPRSLRAPTFHIPCWALLTGDYLRQGRAGLLSLGVAALFPLTPRSSPAAQRGSVLLHPVDK